MKLVAIIALLLLSTLTSFSQVERKSGAVKSDSIVTNTEPANKVARLGYKERMEDLDLTREQRVKMKELMQVNKAAKDAIQNNTQLTDAEKKQQLKDLQKQNLQKIQAILTPEQLQKFKANRKNNP